MIKKIGWSALIYDADWCHFVNNQDDIYISDDRLMCETLDDNKDIVSVECDDNDSNIQRSCHILFKQKETGKEEKALVTQNSGETIVYEFVFPSSPFGACTTYDEFLSLINIKKKVGDEITLLNNNEYTILSPIRSEYVQTQSETITYTVKAFIDEANEVISGDVQRESGDVSISTSSETLTSIDIIGSYEANINKETDVIPFSSLYPDLCQCVMKIDKEDDLTCKGGTVRFSLKKYNCVPDKTITYYNIGIDTTQVSAITSVLKEYFETSLCDNSQIGYSAITESGYTDITGWEVINNQTMITPISGDFNDSRVINLTAQDGVTNLKLKIISELSGVTSNKIISFNIQ